MIEVSVMYPRTDGASFDFQYYLGVHMPLVDQRLGDALKKSVVVKGSSEAPYMAIAHLWFDSLEAFEEVFPQHEQEFMDDVPNYTAISPVIQISEVLKGE